MTKSAKQILRQRGPEIAAELVAKSRATVLRWAPPGVMLTMDYRSDRLTVRLSADNHILDLNCG